MPCWFFEKDNLFNSPSRKNGINFEMEAKYRKEGAMCIAEASYQMGFNYDVHAIAAICFHRFYTIQSFTSFHRYVCASSCLLLAGKLRDSKTNCKDIVETMRSILADEFVVFGSDPQREVLTTERALLETLKFDLQIEHPYSYLLKFAKLLKGNKEILQQLVQTSWAFITDSLCTTLCIEYEPNILAVAALYLSSRLKKFNVSDWHGKPADYTGKWYEQMVEDVNSDILKDICDQVLELYSRNDDNEKTLAESKGLAKSTSLPIHHFSQSDARNATIPEIPGWKNSSRSPSSPHRRRSPSPCIRRSPLPRIRHSASPCKRHSLSPRIRSSPSPHIRCSPSPRIRHSPSPRIRRSPSPHKRHSPSPRSRPSPSPHKKCSLSPRSLRFASPIGHRRRSRVSSITSRGERAPNRSISRSPVRNEKSISVSSDSSLSPRRSPVQFGQQLGPSFLSKERFEELQAELKSQVPTHSGQPCTVFQPPYIIHPPYSDPQNLHPPPRFLPPPNPFHLRGRNPPYSGPQNMPTPHFLPPPNQFHLRPRNLVPPSPTSPHVIPGMPPLHMPPPPLSSSIEQICPRDRYLVTVPIRQEMERIPRPIENTNPHIFQIQPNRVAPPFLQNRVAPPFLQVPQRPSQPGFELPQQLARQRFYALNTPRF